MSPFRSRNAASFARAQRAHDAMEPPDYYEAPEEPERVICDGACEACDACVHSREHDKADDCGPAVECYPAVCSPTGKKRYL